MLARDNFRFAKQAGATHIVAHYCDYFKGAKKNGREDQPTGAQEGWGIAGRADDLWTFEELNRLREAVEDEGLKLEAIENFDPGHWYDILLDGPKKQEHMENVKVLIRNIGRVGIPVFGYNFSLAGVAGRVRGPFARGGAESVGMDGQEDTPMPKGMAWNMVVDSHAPPGNVPSATMEELWQRLEYFLEEILPVAEESGVTPLIQMILPVNRYVVSLDLFTNLICIKSFSI